MNKYLKGIRFQLTFVYSTLFGLGLIVFAIVISNQYFQSGRHDFDSGLYNYAIDLSEYIIIDDSEINIKLNLPVSEQHKEFPFFLNQTFYSVRTLKGKILKSGERKTPFDEIPFDPTLPSKTDYTHRFFSFTHNGETFRAVNVKMTDENNHQMILQVASGLKRLEEREQNHQIITSLMIPLLILSSGFFSFLIAGNALRPIKTLTDSANTIAAKNLSLRVPVGGTGDEIEELSKTLNNLLSRLETSFIAQENFVANASHQLNTPLAIIKGELDVLESKTRGPEEVTRFQKSLREELERLIELVKNMLLISRVESGQENFIFNPLRLDDLLLTITSRLGIKAREKKIIIRFNIDEKLSEKELQVMGEKQLLDSLFENIIDNAIKYSPEESIVELEIKKSDPKIEVWVTDGGPGIKDSELKEILSGRYQRSPSINSPGTGIGLSIAQKIAHYHQAQVLYHPVKPQGSQFIIKFT